MARSRKQTASASRAIPLILRYLREHGADVPRICRRLGLPRAAESLPEVALAPDDFEQLLAAGARELDDPLLALHLADCLQPPSYHIGELAARSAPTLRDAFARVVRYAPLFYAQLAFTLEDDGDELCIRHRLRGRGRDGGHGRYGNEYAIGSTLCHARRQTGTTLFPLHVWFAHPAPRDADGLSSFFGTARIAFDRDDSGLAFSQQDAARPLVGSDERLLRTAEALAERALREQPPELDFVGAVAAQIRKALPAHEAEAATIARRLRLGQRTLQRRLEEHDTTFSQLREEVWRAHCMQLIAGSEVSLALIAERAGFSDPAAFGRAFKRWTGKAPGAYRKAARERATIGS